MSRRSSKRPLPVARQGRLVYRAPKTFDLRRLVTSAREMVQFKLPLLAGASPRFGHVARKLGAREWPALRVLAVGFWAITTVRLVSSYSGSGLHLGSFSAWAVPAVAFLLGVLCWGLPWLRVPIEPLFGAIVVGIALPLLYLSIAGNVHSRDLVSVYIVLALFTAALLPLRTAMAVALVAAVAAAVPLVAGWSELYERALLVLVCVIGLIVYTQTRMLGNFSRQKREADERVRQIEESFMTTLGAVSAMVYGKDRFTETHSRATAMLAVAVAQHLGLKGLALRQIEYAALLHDVGKVSLPAQVLEKPGPLNGEELALVHEHPVIAERILSRVPSLKAICPIVRAQYERWNGSGYPDGLAGEMIPLGGRIIHVCAAFHAMSTDRPYRPALTTDQIISELRSQAGSQFDPRVVEAVVALVRPSDLVAATRLSPHRIQEKQTVKEAPGRESGEQQICRLTAEVAANLLPHDQARVYLVASDRRHLVPSYVSPPERLEAPGTALERRILLPGEGIAGQVFLSGRGMVVGDSDPGLVGFEAPAMKVSVVAVPVTINNDFIGVIEVVKLGMNQYSKSHLRLLKILADQMALSVANARMVDRLAA
ncbi:MAG TPA: HD domain-containing phosphohydrolase [Candidatus Binatus sp.]|nr:HD domain-containing phosphohydrolase [Candidatus Binatus sp.]